MRSMASHLLVSRLIIPAQISPWRGMAQVPFFTHRLNNDSLASAPQEANRENSELGSTG